MRPARDWTLLDLDGLPGPGREDRASPRAACRPEFTCPCCDALVNDPELSRLGYCTRCQEFTGLCAAGRRAAYPGAVMAAGWHLPCTGPGEDLWRFDLPRGGGPARLLFCETHSGQVRGRRAPWVTAAAPLPGGRLRP